MCVGNELENPEANFELPLMSRKRDIWAILLEQFSLDPEQHELFTIEINGTKWNNTPITFGECLNFNDPDLANSPVELLFETKQKSVTQRSPVPNAIRREPGSGTSVSNLSSGVLDRALIPGTNILRLDTVWDSQYAIKTKNPKNGNNAMDCGGCGKKYDARHPTRLLLHFSKRAQGGIGTCPHVYTNEEQIQFDDLFFRSKQKKIRAEAKTLTVSSTVAARTETAALARRATCDGEVEIIQPPVIKNTATMLDDASSSQGMSKRSLKDHFPSNISSSSKNSTSNTRPARLSAKARTTKKHVQRSILTGLHRQTIDYRVENNDRCDAAVADFYYSGNISTRTVDMPEFKYMMQCYKETTPDYDLPNRQKMQNQLLDPCYKTHAATNDELLLSDPETFGISIQSDSATIHRLPFSAVVGHNANNRPVILDIIDATKHLANGGKKDARYFAHMIIKILKKKDPTHTLVDLVMFDGAKNVQNGGKIITAYNPRILSIHGGEHASACFFNDIAKLNPVKVQCCL